MKSIIKQLSDGRTVFYYPEIDIIHIEGRLPFKSKSANEEIKALFGLTSTNDTILPFYPGRNSTGDRY